MRHRVGTRYLSPTEVPSSAAVGEVTVAPYRELGPAESWEVLLGLWEQGLVLQLAGPSTVARPSRAPTGQRAGECLQGGLPGPESFGRTRLRRPAMEIPQEMRAGVCTSCWHQWGAPRTLAHGGVGVGPPLSLRGLKGS